MNVCSCGFSSDNPEEFCIHLAEKWEDVRSTCVIQILN